MSAQKEMAVLQKKEETMDLEMLYQILRDCTLQLRKGPEVVVDGRAATDEEVEGLKENKISGRVVEIFDMPHEQELAGDGVEKVDCHFISVGVDLTKAEQCRDELVAILGNYPRPERLAGGPSYIEVGAVIGDQAKALQLFAVGKVLGFWEVITPKKLGITGTAADELAGRGMVMISGFKAI